MDVADGSALLQVENSTNRKSEAVLEVKVALKTYGRQKILNFHFLGKYLRLSALRHRGWLAKYLNLSKPLKKSFFKIERSFPVSLNENTHPTSTVSKYTGNTCCKSRKTVEYQALLPPQSKESPKSCFALQSHPCSNPLLPKGVMITSNS